MGVNDYVGVTVIKFLVLESRLSKPKMVCRKEEGTGRVSTWQPLCGWCYIALLCLLRPEKQMKCFLLLLSCVALTTRRRSQAMWKADVRF